MVGCAIVAKAGARPASIEEIIAAHPRIHTAEGCFYRDVLLAAARVSGIAPRVFPPKELDAAAEKALKIDESEITRLLAKIGSAVGSPWGKDQKMAALAAFTLLGETAPARGAR